MDYADRRLEGGDVVEGLGERVLGRVASADLALGGDGEVLVQAGTLIDEKVVKLLEKMGIDHVGAFADHLRNALWRLRTACTV